MKGKGACGCPPPTPSCHGETEYHRFAEQKRFYIRNRNRVFVAVGWICPVCHKITLDEDAEFA